MNKNSATLRREASSDQTSVPTMTRSLLGKYARQFDSSPVSLPGHERPAKLQKIKLNRIGRDHKKRRPAH